MGSPRGVGENNKWDADAPGHQSYWVWVLSASGGRSSVVDDQLNVPLVDAELLAEVEMTTNLIIAATESEVSLSQDAVDQLLGLPAGIPFQQVRSGP